MKNLILTLITFLVFVSGTGLAYASDLSSLVDSLKNKFNNKQTEAGSMDFSCQDSPPENPDKYAILDSHVVNLGVVSIENANMPYFIHLKRNSKTPKKVIVKYMNQEFGNSDCGVFGCSEGVDAQLSKELNKYPLREQAFEINFDESRTLKEDEFQVLELRLTKSDVKSVYFVLEVAQVEGPPVYCQMNHQWMSGIINFLKNSVGRGVKTYQLNCRS